MRRSRRFLRTKRTPYVRRRGTAAGAARKPVAQVEWIFIHRLFSRGGANLLVDVRRAAVSFGRPRNRGQSLGKTGPRPRNVPGVASKWQAVFGNDFSGALLVFRVSYRERWRADQISTTCSRSARRDYSFYGGLGRRLSAGDAQPASESWQNGFFCAQAPRFAKLRSSDRMSFLK